MGHTLCETCIQTSTKLLDLQIKMLLYQRSFGWGGATRGSSVAWIHQVARIHQVAQTEWGLDFKEEKQTVPANNTVHIYGGEGEYSTRKKGTVV